MHLKIWLCGLLIVAPGTGSVRQKPAPHPDRDAATHFLEGALERYQALAARGGWLVVPSGPRLKLAARDIRVSAPAATGDMPDTYPFGV